MISCRNVKRATPVIHSINCFSLKWWQTDGVCRHAPQPPTHLIPFPLSADVLSRQEDYCASDKVFLSRCEVNLILASDKATDRRRTGAPHQLWRQQINLHWRRGFPKNKEINKPIKDKTEIRGGSWGQDGSPASATERASCVIAAGRLRRSSSSDRMFTYLPWPAEPQGSRIIADKRYIFRLICALHCHVNHCPMCSLATHRTMFKDR